MRFPIKALFILALSAAAAPLLPALPSPDPLPPRVLILANRDDPDSLAIANHYAAARGVPQANIFALSMSRQETISWAEFISTIWQPLRDELVRQHWLDAIAMSDTDAIGRRKYALSGHRIAALVVCRGVPLKISHDPNLYAPAPPYTNHAEFRTNAGAVDSELSLLAWDGVYSINAFIPNPLFHKDRPTVFDSAKVVKVSRLDGPTSADAMGLVDRAITAERDGLLGRGYVDRGGNFSDGNRWLEAVEAQIAALGFDESVDTEPSTFPPTARFDAPVLYFGWHEADLNGPFAIPGFQFPAGAIALHIYSYSARTLRSPTEGWSGPLVAHGVTATVGNVFEPFLQYTHRPDLFLWALARGDTLADSAYYALPALSWEAILIGDPLYRPFAVSIESQLKQIGRLPARLAGYAVIRQARLLEASGHSSRALAVLREGLSEHPNLALGVALAQRLRLAGERAEAERALDLARTVTEMRPDEWGLEHEAAELFGAMGRHDRAVETYRRLFEAAGIPSEVRARWLVDALRHALDAKDPAQAESWKRDLDDAVAQILRKKP